MPFDADTVKAIADLGTKAQASERIDIPGFPNKALIDTPEGIKEFEFPPAPRRPTFDSFDAFAEYVAEAAPIAAYVGTTVIHAETDRGPPPESAHLPLVASDALCALRSLTSGVVFSQREAIRFLRFNMPGAHATAVIAALRKVDFSRRAAGGGTIEHGKETLGQSVEAEVQQRDQIPESFRVSIPPYVVAGLNGLRIEAEVAVHLDAEQQMIEFRLAADEIRLAELAARQMVADRLRTGLESVSTAVYLGSP